jgi:undecaprenyl-diphosphatase
VEAGLIGLWQCLAIIPGVSRSGRDHRRGGLVLGWRRRRRRSSRSSWPSRPWSAAFALDLLKTKDIDRLHFAWIIAIGFVVSFVSGLIVVRWMVSFVSKHGFAPFAWWRIAMAHGPGR